MKKQIEQLISQGKTRKAIELLLQMVTQLDDRDLKNEVIMLSARFKDAEKEKNMGTSSTADYNLSLNRINQSLLSILEKLPDEAPTKAKKENTSGASTIPQADRPGGEKQSLKERNIAIIFGVSFLLLMLTLSVFFPEPSAFQYTVFRIVLALAVAGAATMLAGFLQVHVGKAIRSGGAIAVFIVVYFFSPAQLVVMPQASFETVSKPFLASNLDSPFAIKSQFEGEAVVSEKQIEINVDKALLTFPKAAPDSTGRYIEYIQAALVNDPQSNGAWNIVAQSGRHPVGLDFPIGMKKQLDAFHLNISLDGIEKLSTHWLLFTVGSKIDENDFEIGTSNAHSSPDVFGGI